jgi:hypothetical protein
MLHDPNAFGHLSRRMRHPQPLRESVELPPVDELVRRLDAAAAKRRG